MVSVHQAIHIAGTNTYKFGPPKGLTLPISNAPADTDWQRWAMLHDGVDYRLYTFKDNSPDTLYQFGWTGQALQYGHKSVPQLTIQDIPQDADTRSFSVTYGEDNYRLYLRQFGHPTQLYQFEWNVAAMAYMPCSGKRFQLQIPGFPPDTDWHRWSILNSGGTTYHLYAAKLGSNHEIYEGSWHSPEDDYGDSDTYNIFTLEGMPPDSNLASLEVLHDGIDYRLYLQTL
ncbi:hypothetical protein D0962_07770 [Leptolyngbyaceae cyanobacterium CCMR0082]|uniref:Uncharacterized protein n=1 Tax=Adonisia turfae CCMR0082 TaxID=2304604 RepID=A0A6M0S2H8_9CYAN|nr:hypothetical protein [Adonisia turfae]NEZ62679.1 hypothetical protein [Adonisia turfae CCMR0082]